MLSFKEDLHLLLLGAREHCWFRSTLGGSNFNVEFIYSLETTHQITTGKPQAHIHGLIRYFWNNFTYLKLFLVLMFSFQELSTVTREHVLKKWQPSFLEKAKRLEN